MGNIERSLPEPDPAEMADRLRRRANNILALAEENDELVAEVSRLHHQHRGAVEALRELVEASGAVPIAASEASDETLERFIRARHEARTVVGGQ